MTADATTAGAALDAEVARRVFGHRVINPDAIDVPREEVRSTWRVEITQEGMAYVPVPRYSTDFAAAMTVFEAMVEMTGHGEIVADMEDARGEGFVCSVMFGFDDEAVGSIGPLPLSICRAALAAIGAAATPERPGREDG